MIKTLKFLFIFILLILDLRGLAAQSKDNFCALVLSGGPPPPVVARTEKPELVGNTIDSDIGLTRIGTTDLLTLQIISEQDNLSLSQIGALINGRVFFLTEVRNKLAKLREQTPNLEKGNKFSLNIYRQLWHKTSAKQPKRELAAQLILKIRQKKTEIAWAIKAHLYQSKKLLTLINESHKVLQENLQQNIELSFNISDSPTSEQAALVREAILDVMVYSQVGEIHGSAYQDILENHTRILQTIQTQLIEEYETVLEELSNDAEAYI